ncbi:DNA primase large subunit [Cytidiella melzeri]|nr:DNA primase large subunit [Cytidiella melzeri]
MFKSSNKKPGQSTYASQVEKYSPLKYPHRLNFYDRPPLDDITIEEFEICALDRLRILAEIESSYARNRSWDELKDVAQKHSEKYLPLNSNTAKFKSLEAERRKDHIGHFVLRLAFCRTEELRRRFVKAELALFKVRWDTDDRAEREEFLQSRDFGWDAVDDAELKQYAAELSMAASVPPNSNVPPEKHYKVRWTRVPDLVEKRKVFLKGGMAYVPAKEQASIVFEEFQRSLEKSLQLTLKHLPRLDEDTRIVPLLDNLSQGFQAGISSEWSSASEAVGDEVTADMIDDFSRKHFPMCMRHLHESLRRDKHLKHHARLQYGLFLKVLGLSIDEAVTFWRRSFSTMQDDKFNKEYKYNIRHSYGLEGKRANYPARSCQQILMGETPGAQDSHGCPFRHFSPENLQTGLLSMYSHQGFRESDLLEIMSHVNSKTPHYHVACTRVFEITHGSKGVKKGDGVGSGESVTHPNQYAARSRELEKGPADSGTVKTEGDGDVTMG